MRKHLIPGLAISLLLALSATSAQARHHDRGYHEHEHHHYYHDEGRRHHKRTSKAKVIRVKPIYETRRVKVKDWRCRPGERYVRYDRGDSRDEMLVGGVVGGILGNQLANRGHRTEATIAGTVIGGILGHEIGNRPARRHVEYGPERCRKVSRYRNKDVVVGYRVKYRYKGETYRTRTRNHPGNYLRVNRRGHPIEY
jgi:uncharacterized protein YcfJ